MLAVVQRVAGAEVLVGGQQVAKIGRGLVAFVGVELGDGEEEAKHTGLKLVQLRVFPDPEGRMNLSLKEVGRELLLVPNFTVAGDCRKGRRPSFERAAPPAEAERLLSFLARLLEEEGLKVSLGRFGAAMRVVVENDGPVTVLLDSRKRL